MPVPDFSPGEVLTAAAMDSIGLWLVKTQTVGTAVSSVTVTGAFSADYDNYRITWTGGTQSADAHISLQLGASNTAYYGFMTYGDATVNANQSSILNNNNIFSWVGGGASGQAGHVMVDVLRPFATTYTKIRGGQYQNGLLFGTVNGEHRVAASYSSFVLAVNSGTMTGGTIRVYGYRN